MPHYIAPGDSAFLVTGGLLPPPEGYLEVTPEEYERRLAAQQELAEKRVTEAAATDTHV